MVCSFGSQTCMGFNFQFGPPVVCELSPMPWDAPTASLVNDANWDHYSIIPWNCNISHTRRPLGVLLKVTILSSLASTEVITMTTSGAYSDKSWHRELGLQWKNVPYNTNNISCFFLNLFYNVIFSDISRFIEIFTHIRHWGYNVIGLSYVNSPSNDERYGFNRQFSNHHHRRSSNNKALTAYITLLGNYDINAEALSLNSSCWINMLRLWKNRGDKLTWPPSH